MKLIKLKKIVACMSFFMLLFGCKEETPIDITATGNNGDGTVNIEYKKGGKYYSSFHISVDSLLTLIKELK